MQMRLSEQAVAQIQAELHRRRALAPPIQAARSNGRGARRVSQDPDWQLLKALKKARLWPLPEGMSLDEALAKLQEEPA